MQEQALEFLIAHVIGLGPIRPGGVKALEKKWVGIAHPQTGLRREPVQPLQPFDCGLQSIIIQHLRFLRFSFLGFFPNPLVAAPLPHRIVALALGQQLQPHRLLRHLKDKTRGGLVSFAKLLPIDAIGRLDFAEIGQQPVRELGDRGLLLAGPIAKHLRRWRVAKEKHLGPDQRQRRLPGEKDYVRHWARFFPGQFDRVCEIQVGLVLLEIRFHLDDAPHELDRLGLTLQLDAIALAPLHQPLQEISPLERDQLCFGIVVIPDAR